MARIRSTHATQWNDDDFIECSPFARLLALALRNFADDQGVFEWKPGQIKRNCLPADACDVRPLLKELTANKQVQPFSVDGKDYGAIRNFRLWQRPKSPTALYPLPAELRKYVGLVTVSISANDMPSRGADFGNGTRTQGPTISEMAHAVVVVNSEIAGADVGCRRLEVGGEKEEDTSSLRSDVVPAQPKIEPQAVLVLEPDREIATITELPAVLDRTEEGAAFQAYNATADEMGWPVAQRLTDPRRRSLKLRLRECGGVDGWREAMAKARASPFLSGTGPRGKGYENWTPDLDYFLQPSTFTKLMEGKYDERLNPGSSNGFSSPVFTGAASAIARRRRARETGEGLESQADHGSGSPIAAGGTG